VRFAGFNGQVDALENLPTLDGDVQIANFQHGVLKSLWFEDH
jgi:hypothetical protein